MKKLASLSGGPRGMLITAKSDASFEPLDQLLSIKNGFFAFESALEVFPNTELNYNYSLRWWNKTELWKEVYSDIAPTGLCFAQDIFGVQFVIEDGVYSFDPETAERSLIARDLDGWADRIMGEYDILTGYNVAHEWQVRHGKIREGRRLVPITPFVLGGSFDIENLVDMDMVRGMRLRGNLAQQIRDIPEGATVKYQITD